MATLRNVAVYNGSTYQMGEATPQDFLDHGLVPNFPDLRGATWTTEVDELRGEQRFVYAKRAGQKGLTNR